MSANESTPAVSLREARQREDHAKELMYYYPTPANRERHAAARRATDEALLAAFLKWFALQPWVELERLGFYDSDDHESNPNWPAVLDAVEREETER